MSLSNPRQAARSSTTSGFLALLFGAAAIGLAPIFVRLSELGPYATAFWRILLSQPVLWALVYRETGKRATRPRPKKQVLSLLGAGAIFGIEICVWHTSVWHTTVANSTLLCNLAPVFVVLLARALYGQRTTATFHVGLAVALVGAAMLGGASFQVSRRYVVGDSLALVSAFLYAVYLMSVNRLRASHSSAVFMAWSGVSATCLLLPISWAAGEDLFAVTEEGWLVLVGLALICHVAGQGLITFGLGRLSATVSSVVLLFQPVVAAALAWWIFEEAMGALQGLGSLLVLAGISGARRAGSTD